MMKITGLFAVVAGAGFIASPALATDASTDAAQISTSTSNPAATSGPILGPLPIGRQSSATLPEAHATAYSGFYHAGSGFTDRFVTGGFIDLYRGSTGFHADLAYVNREDDGAYGALGVSSRIRGLGRLKLMAGTSTGRQNVLPELYLNAGLELYPSKGLIVRPGVSYRRFRNGSSQVAPAVQAAFYFGGGSGGHFVAQADAGMQFTNPGKTGWSLGAGITHVRDNGLRLGVAAHRGYMAYDTLLGSEVRSSFYGGGPTIGFRFLGGQELFIRSDVSRNKHYTVTGALVGFKIAL